MQAEDDQKALVEALKAQVGKLVASFEAARAAEGKALGAIPAEQLAQIADLVEAARKAARERLPQMRETLIAKLKLVMANADGADEARVAQELALLTVKTDVSEELDRLKAPISPRRRDLLAEGTAIGRKLDFLAQEFNRETNTLCSKSPDHADDADRAGAEGRDRADARAGTEPAVTCAPPIRARPA